MCCKICGVDRKTGNNSVLNYENKRMKQLLFIISTLVDLKEVCDSCVISVKRKYFYINNATEISQLEVLEWIAKRSYDMSLKYFVSKDDKKKLHIQRQNLTLRANGQFKRYYEQNRDKHIAKVNDYKQKQKDKIGEKEYNAMRSKRNRELYQERKTNGTLIKREKYVPKHKLAINDVVGKIECEEVITERKEFSLFLKETFLNLSLIEKREFMGNGLNDFKKQSDINHKLNTKNIKLMIERIEENIECLSIDYKQRYKKDLFTDARRSFFKLCYEQWLNKGKENAKNN